jgi:CheY-like chemotaxis protein
MKILIVDDSLIDRKLTMNLLKKNGIENEVIQAADGEKGLEALSANYKDICLVLLDWQMPNVDGIEFMGATVKVPLTASIPIIMITASGSDEDKRKAREVNPNLAAYIVKPYKPQDFIDSIKPHLK